MEDLARRALGHPFARAGVPMILFVTLGSYALSFFVQGQHDMQKVSKSKKSLTQRQYDIEEDHKKTLAKLVSSADYELVCVCSSCRN
jgi:hypothetical protein